MIPAPDFQIPNHTCTTACTICCELPLGKGLSVSICFHVYRWKKEERTEQGAGGTEKRKLQTLHSQAKEG